MKRLTINKIARAGLKYEKRAYLSLAVGVFLSIFLITALVLSVQGVYLGQREQVAQRLGYEDFFILDSDYSDETVRDEGIFDDAIGHVYVSAKIKGTESYLGYYDETGATMLSRQTLEGRFPETSGEIALEQSVLESMRLEEGVGDTIELTVVPIDGVEEEKRFTIVGILAEQSEYLYDDNSQFANRERRFPAVLVYEGERFVTGRTAIHQLLKVRNGLSKQKAHTQWVARHEYSEPFYSVNLTGKVSVFPDDIYTATSSVDDLLLMALMLGGGLILATCIGIAQAMEGQLNRRIEQIGMLRAVGATRRQIRKIFGREAWLLAGILTPVGVAAGCGFVWALSKFLSKTVIFRATPVLLIPIFIMAVGCILLSACVPLAHASHTTPMSVIRDTELLRKSKTVRGKKNFDVSRLVSIRQLRMHPARQIGASAIVAVTLFFASGIIVILYNMQQTLGYFEDQAAFNLSADRHRSYSSDFADTLPQTTLTDQDVVQIENLPQVKRVDVNRKLMVNLLVDEVTEYMVKEVKYGANIVVNDHLATEEHTSEIHEQTKEKLGVSDTLLTCEMAACDMDLKANLTKYVVDGRIDMDALNAGREVILVAPSHFVEILYDSDGSYGSRSEKLREGVEYIEDANHFLCINDYFKVGQTLDIIQLYRIGTAGTFSQESVGVENFERRDANVTVGAIVDGNNLGINSIGLVTTVQGARAMGLYTETVDEIDVYLKGDIDLATEELIENRLEAIAMRGQRIEVYNSLSAAREQRASNRSLILAIACVTLVFFALSISIISGNVGRCIRADKKTLGMLRAVGAKRRALVGCYSGQVRMSIIIGMLGAFVLFAWYMKSISAFDLNVLIPAVCMVIGVAVFIYGCCHIKLKKTLSEIMRRSIVENIKEL